MLHLFGVRRGSQLMNSLVEMYIILNSSYSLTEQIEARAYSLQPFWIVTSEAGKYIKNILANYIKM